MAKDDRLYAKFTLDFPDSPKIKPLPVEAKWALVEMICYSRRMKTDGFLSKALALASWGAEICHLLATNDPDKPSLIEVDKGYQIHDFAEHQSTSAEIDALTEKRRAAGQKGGKASAKAKAKQVLEQNTSKSNPETETETTSGYVRDDTHQSNTREIVDTPPEHIDNAAKPARPQPSSAARTVVRHEIGAIGQPYPRTTHERLAVQVDKLARDHADTVIREALREWDQRPSCDKPEFLPTVLGDVVKRSRAAPAPPPTSKLRATADLAARQRAREQAAINGTTTITRELE